MPCHERKGNGRKLRRHRNGGSEAKASDIDFLNRHEQVIFLSLIDYGGTVAAGGIRDGAEPGATETGDAHGNTLFGAGTGSGQHSPCATSDYRH